MQIGRKMIEQFLKPLNQNSGGNYNLYGEEGESEEQIFLLNLYNCIHVPLCY